MKQIQQLLYAILLSSVITGSSYAQSQWDGKIPMHDASAQYSGGSGTEDDPFLIGSAADFAQFSANVRMAKEAVTGKYFLLTTDLDMGGIYNSTTKKWEGKQWLPIGSYEGDMSGKFNGTFDGGGHSISNLDIRFSGYYETVYFRINQGLFCSIGPEGTVKNLRIVSGYIEGHEYTGAIAGYNRGKIIACVNDGMRIDGDSTDIRGLAGITGFNYGTVAGCYSTGSIETERGNELISGIAFGGTVNGCFHTTKEAATGNASARGTYIENREILNSHEIVTSLNAAIGGENSLYFGIGDTLPEFVTQAPATYTVSGNIRTQAENFPLEGAIVTLNLAGIQIATTYADKQGNYTFNAISAKEYTIEATIVGYAPITSESFDIENSPVAGVDILLSIDPDYDWYINNPSATIFSITSINELRALGKIIRGINGLMDNFEGKYIQLNTDLDLGGIYNETEQKWGGMQWEPLGNYPSNNNEDNTFNGIFDGNGHTVSNIFIGRTGNYTLHDIKQNQGLFSAIGSKGTVKNLHIISGCVRGDGYIGSIAGLNRGNIVACTNRADVSGDNPNTRYLGGIAGNNTGCIIGCINAGALPNDRKEIGGITINGTVQAGFYVATSDIGSGTLPRGTRVNDIAELNKASVLDLLNNNIAEWNNGHPDIATPFRFTAGTDPETDLPYLAFPTGVCETAEEADITVYSSNGAIIIEGIAPGTPYSITGFTGIMFDSRTAADDRITIPALQGFYIVKVGAKAAKVEVR